MTAEDIITILLGLLSVAGCFLSYYFFVRNRIAEALSEKIDNKEIDGVAGAEKKAEVIAELQKLIPGILKPFISKELLDGLVEMAFKSIESYAEKQVKKQLEEKKDEVD